MAKVGGKREGAGRPIGGMGRLKKEFDKLIRPQDIRKAMEVLREKIDNKDSDAAKYILDQKFGKARQRVEGSIEGGIIIMVNDVTGQE